MGGAVVGDQVQRFFLGRFAADLAQELQPFGVGVALLAWADDLAVTHVGCSLGVPRDRVAAHPVRLQVVRLPVPPHRAGAELQHRSQLAPAPVHGRLGRALRRQLQPLRNVHLHRRRSVRPTPFHALHPRRHVAFVPVCNPRLRAPVQTEAERWRRQQTCVHSPVKHPAARRAVAALAGRLRQAIRSAVHRLLPNGTEFNRESSGLHRGDIFKKIRGCDCASPPKR